MSQTQEIMESQDEIEKLDQFKQNVSKHLVKDRFEHQDIYLRKWLVARDWDVPKATSMFLNHHYYRAELNLDNVETDWQAPEVLNKFYCGGIIGSDKEGRPVKLAHAGLDMRGLMHSCHRQDMIMFKMRENERVVKLMEKQSEKLGKPILQMTVVYDMENSGASLLWRPSMNFQITMMKLLEDNYPEVINKMIIINAPSVFPIIWKISRPFISDATKQKISVYGKDFKNALLEHIDVNELPQFYGGNKVDSTGDPRMAAEVGSPIKVPESYYLTELSSNENLENLTVRCGEVARLKYKVDNQGTLIKWEFKTEGYDVGFAVEYEDAKQNRHLIVKNQRLNSHIAPEFGNVICQQAGIYHIIFDNSFSWTRSKRIQYNVELASGENTMTCELTNLQFDKTAL